MKQNKLSLLFLTGCLTVLAGCASADTAKTTASATASAASTDSTSETSTAASFTATSGAIDASDMFSDRDLEQSADTSDALQYTVSDGQNISITEEGVYVITGTASNVTITVEADDSAKVQIVLDNTSIINDSAPVIYVKSADKVFVTLLNDNSLSVTGTFTADGDTNTDAVIFSKQDLTLNGTGTLTINSTDNGISSHDDLKITGGTYNVTASHNAFEAHDSIAIAAGTFNINAGNNGFRSKDKDDDTVGYVYIYDGTFNINASSDGIHATTILEIDGGTFNITAAEALEATYVQINDGNITISASDDGINAAAKSTACDVKIEINGGTLSITMGDGDTDALDANGSLIINGGTIEITAQFAFDYDTSAELNGGTVTVNGEQVTAITESMQMGGGGPMGGSAPSGNGGPGQRQ